MVASFAAFMNKCGIACASDTDMTMYSLSRQEPVVIAVNSYSPIPWDSLINSYLRQGEIAKHTDFIDYAHDFIDFLLTTYKPALKSLTKDDGNILFLGYGTDDVFPSGVDIYFSLDNDGNFVCDECEAFRVTHRCPACIGRLSQFTHTQPITDGILDAIRNKMVDKHLSQFDIFKKRILQAVKGTEFEKAVSDTLAEEVPAKDFYDTLCAVSNIQEERIHKTLDTFNMEDLVNIAEEFVDTEVQITHMKNGGKEELRHTKELAVITRTEGVVWIKHCLYGN